ncbi:MAG: helix-turn-helix domain-containing protein [Clostridiales bacterium]|nr:helix-turn-helix domain-containing protein [Clostridiales bacterium]
MITIGKILYELRKSAGLTQEHLAAALNISRVNYSRYESDIHRPDYESLVALADFFDVSVDFLLGRKEC